MRYVEPVTLSFFYLFLCVIRWSDGSCHDRETDIIPKRNTVEIFSIFSDSTMTGERYDCFGEVIISSCSIISVYIRQLPWKI